MNLRNYASRLRWVAVRGKAVSQPNASEAYDSRVQAETKFFSGCQDANELPAIYGYWSNKYLRPKLEHFGFPHPEAVFWHYFSEAYIAGLNPRRTFLSVGSGACDTEIRLAEELVKRGHHDFTIDCLELNSGLLERAQALAAEKGVGTHIVALRGDFNKWNPTKTYDGVLANSSLHHVLNLEGLLDGIRSSLAPTGYFVTCDTIGRNGHLRWPEALDIVHEYWRELPRDHTYNHLLKRHEALYDNWDCSVDGFEGIRAQDILPLLIDRFDFAFFVPFGNVIDPFIDRTFGHNFKLDNPWDLAFIDRVHLRDQAEMARGAIKPTHIVAAMCTVPPPSALIEEGFAPGFCVRTPSRSPVPHAPLPDLGAVYSAAARGTETRVAGTPADAAQPGQLLRPSIDYTDMWWDPLEPGWGLSIHQHATGALFAVWLTFDEKNDPIWYSLQPGGWTGLETFSGPIYITTGPLADGQLSTTGAQSREVGTGTLEFVDRENGTFAYSLHGAAGVKRIARMLF